MKTLDKLCKLAERYFGSDPRKGRDRQAVLARAAVIMVGTEAGLTYNAIRTELGCDPWYILKAHSDNPMLVKILPKFREAMGLTSAISFKASVEELVSVAKEADQELSASLHEEFHPEICHRIRKAVKEVENEL